MIEVHIQERWDWMRKDVYILDRLPEGLYIVDLQGNKRHIAPETNITNEPPTFSIKHEWEQEFIEKLDPMIERSTEETKISLHVERARVDKMLDYLIGGD